MPGAEHPSSSADWGTSPDGSFSPREAVRGEVEAVSSLGAKYMRGARRAPPRDRRGTYLHTGPVVAGRALKVLQLSTRRIRAKCRPGIRFPPAAISEKAT